MMLLLLMLSLRLRLQLLVDQVLVLALVLFPLLLPLLLLMLLPLLLLLLLLLLLRPLLLLLPLSLRWDESAVLPLFGATIWRHVHIHREVLELITVLQSKPPRSRSNLRNARAAQEPQVSGFEAGF
jgi:hypothetical protein